MEEAPLVLDDDEEERRVNEASSRSESKRSKKNSAPAAAFDEEGGDPNLWSVSKVPRFVAEKKVRGQCFARDNSDSVRLVDERTVECLGGYRSGRAALGLCEGAAYFETVVPESGSVRAGWSVEHGDPGAGVGYDAWQYGIRERDGAVFHSSRGRSFGESFAPGDVIGAYLFLPPRPAVHFEEQSPPVDPAKPLAEIVEEKPHCWLVRVIPGQPYSLPTSEVVPVARRGSAVLFFKNGKCLGVAFRDVVGGFYYPAVSPFRSRVTVNWGPSWKYPPEIPDEFPQPLPASALERPK